MGVHILADVNVTFDYHFSSLWSKALWRSQQLSWDDKKKSSPPLDLHFSIHKALHNIEESQFFMKNAPLTNHMLPSFLQCSEESHPWCHDLHTLLLRSSNVSVSHPTTFVGWNGSCSIDSHFEDAQQCIFGTSIPSSSSSNCALTSWKPLGTEVRLTSNKINCRTCALLNLLLSWHDWHLLSFDTPISKCFLHPSSLQKQHPWNVTWSWFKALLSTLHSQASLPTSFSKLILFFANV